MSYKCYRFWADIRYMNDSQTLPTFKQRKETLWEMASNDDTFKYD